MEENDPKIIFVHSSFFSFVHWDFCRISKPPNYTQHFWSLDEWGNSTLQSKTFANPEANTLYLAICTTQEHAYVQFQQLQIKAGYLLISWSLLIRFPSMLLMLKSSTALEIRGNQVPKHFWAGQHLTTARNLGAFRNFMGDLMDTAWSLPNEKNSGIHSAGKCYLRCSSKTLQLSVFQTTVTLERGQHSASSDCKEITPQLLNGFN